jgi:hypothetical protein
LLPRESGQHAEERTSELDKGLECFHTITGHLAYIELD